MPKVSVILPAAYVEKYIAKSIQSVVNQTFQDFELLVVIDGSPDRSKEVAESFTDERIKVFEKPNGGLSDARNYGMERAAGEFLYFLDSDDWIEPNLLEENLKIIEAENLNFLVFGYIQDDEDMEGNILSTREVSPENLGYKRGDKNLEIDMHHLGLLGYSWNKIYRKSFIDRNQFKFPKGISLVEDILFNAPIYTISEEIHFNSKCYYHYINRDEKTLTKKFYDNALELLKKEYKVLDKFTSEWGLNENDKNELLSSRYIRRVRNSIHNLYISLNEMDTEDKKRFIEKLVYDQTTQKLIDYYPTESIKDRVYKFCIQNKRVGLIMSLAKLSK